MRIGLVLLLLLVACGGQASQTPASTPFDPTGTWQLVDGTIGGEPIPLVADHRITLDISASRITGVAACNGYGGELRMRNGRLEIVDLAMTAMACVDEGVMESEAAYTRALERVDAMGMDGEQLVLGGQDVELRFAQLAPPPVADLVDTRWVLETLIVGDVAAAAMGEEATLELRSDGTLVGSTGCRGLDGRWIEQGDQILATQLAASANVCPPDLAEQDSQVTSVVGDGFVPVIEGRLLTLTDPGGIGLVYRAPGG